MPDSEHLDILRMTKAQVDVLLSQLDAGRRENMRKSRRISFPYYVRLRMSIVYPTRIVFPTRHEGNYWAYARDISDCGIGLLHGKFAYPNSRCRIELPRLDKDVDEFSGTVRWCELLEGRAHIVGVEFDSPIEVADYVGTVSA